VPPRRVYIDNTPLIQRRTTRLSTLFRNRPVQKIRILDLADLPDRDPQYALVANVDLVIVRADGTVSVLYGRCHHRGALLADGHVDGDNLICGLHGWDYRYDTGISEYNNAEALARFNSWIEDDAVWVDADEIAAWEHTHPQPYNRDAYQGAYADVHGAPEEPFVKEIQSFAAHGLAKVGHHGPTDAMGVPRDRLPLWDDVQFVTAQLDRLPRLDDAPVGTEVVIGPRAKRPLVLKIPLFVSDMSFGALSEEAKLALARGAELAGTGIASGEGGMLPEEQEANGRYFYELASARFGYSMAKVERCQAFHFKGGQGAKTGTGGHLPGEKVQGRIAEVRGLEPGTPAISPARFPDWTSLDDYRRFAAEVRLQAIGCLGMRACHSNNCPVGIATQKPHLRARLPVDLAAERLARYFGAVTELIQVICRACGHDHVGKLQPDDLTTFKSEIAELTGIAYGGVARS